MDFLQYIINGVSIGTIYAIIALGYTMVYGIAKMLNFAHGDVIMVGGFMAYTAISRMGMPELAAVPVAMLVCVVLGMLIEGLAYRPLRGAPSLAVLITAIGVSIFLQNAAQQIWHADPKVYAGNMGNISLFGGALNISGDAPVNIAVAVAIMVALTWFTSRTRTGKAMRAVSEDRDAAALMGINVNRTISITFAIGSGLAAVAGVLLWHKTNLQPTFGAMPGIKAFTAAVLGGVGSMPGAMLGGVLLGLVETLSKAYISTQFSDAIVFSVLIVILLVKPTGILGKKIQEKV
jgi:branched-chain amino acid transport system permease protein